MSSRLDQDLEKELTPKRMAFAKNAIQCLGYEITFESEVELRFNHNGSEVKLFPYSGWHTGKTITDGRGISKLLKQLQ